MFVRTIFCCVKKNMIALLSFYISLFANKIDETDKIFIILMWMCVCMFARIRRYDLMRIMMCTVKETGRREWRGTESKSAEREMQELRTRDRQMLTIKYAMKIREEQHQHMLSPSLLLLLLLLHGIGKIQSETKCLLFIVEMDVIWAKNMNESI